MLHIINKSPIESNQLVRCLEYISDGDSLVLIENGVYAATMPSGLEQLPVDIELCVLEADIEARGLDKDRIAGHYKIINYHDFVKRVTQHPVNQSW